MTMSLGKTIAQFRKQKHFNQAEVAQRLGIHQSLVARWESDKTKPRKKSLQRLAETLDVDIESLLAGDFAPPTLDDPELASLLQELPKLGVNQKTVLKLLLQDLIKLSELESVMTRQQRAS